ncbi:host cell division inhibitor Icd-like protein [Serratia sp. P2ACOL2]|nr:host cell division inhibitor Icd-like protein [Serratia sp. P2ACOL2]
MMADYYKEKGSTANAALWDDGFLNQKHCQYIAERRGRHYENFVGHISTCTKSVGQLSGDSLGFLRCRRLISPCMAVTMNCPVVSPSSLTDSIASTTSCGARACTFCDFALIAFVAKAETSCCWWRTVYTKDKAEKVLTCLHLGFKVESTLSYLRCVYDEAQKDGNPLWASNHNVTETYIMACSHDTQTRPAKTYLWRFIALNRIDLKSVPCRLSVEAATERDARRILAPHFILSLAARLPIQGVMEMITPSTVEKTSMEVRYAQA